MYLATRLSTDCAESELAPSASAASVSRVLRFITPPCSKIVSGSNYPARRVDVVAGCLAPPCDFTAVVDGVGETIRTAECAEIEHRAIGPEERVAPAGRRTAVGRPRRAHDVASRIDVLREPIHATECAEIDHRRSVPQERMSIADVPAHRPGEPHDIAALIDCHAFAFVAAKGTEIDHGVTIPEESVRVARRGRADARDVPRRIDREPGAMTAAECADVGHRALEGDERMTVGYGDSTECPGRRRRGACDFAGWIHGIRDAGGTAERPEVMHRPVPIEPVHLAANGGAPADDISRRV